MSVTMQNLIFSNTESVGALVEEIQFLMHYWRTTANVASLEFKHNYRYAELIRRLLDFEKLIGDKLFQMKQMDLTFFAQFIKNEPIIESIWASYTLVYSS